MSAVTAWNMVVQRVRRARGSVKRADPRAHRAVMICGGYERLDRRRDLVRPLFLRLYRLLGELDQLPPISRRADRW